MGGYIIPHGPRHINTNDLHVTAFVVPDLPINLISVAWAARCNLDVQLFQSNSTVPLHIDNADGGDGVLLDFDNGRRPEKTIGRTTLLWSRISHWQRDNTLYLAVECEVCDNAEVGLILGSPFVEARERRRSSLIASWGD
jgi:hypothetical protein